MIDTSPAGYAASIARQAASESDEGLVHLLIYATRATIAGSKAAAISEAETEAVLAEYRKRGLALPFWARSVDKAVENEWGDDPLGAWHGRNE